VGRKPDIQHFVGCKPVKTRRLPGRAPSTMAIFNIENRIPKSRHRGWSTHLVSRRYSLAQPNRTANSIFVTLGGIGPHRMHPPRKRNHRDSNITSGSHKQFDTRGSAQRPAPTRNSSLKTSTRNRAEPVVLHPNPAQQPRSDSRGPAQRPAPTRNSSTKTSTRYRAQPVVMHLNPAHQPRIDTRGRTQRSAPTRSLPCWMENTQPPKSGSFTPLKWPSSDFLAQAYKLSVIYGLP
jgi:hypothetical protein